MVIIIVQLTKYDTLIYKNILVFLSVLEHYGIEKGVKLHCKWYQNNHELRMRTMLYAAHSGFVMNDQIPSISSLEKITRGSLKRENKPKFIFTCRNSNIQTH